MQISLFILPIIVDITNNKIRKIVIITIRLKLTTTIKVVIHTTLIIQAIIQAIIILSSIINSQVTVQQI